MEIVTSTIATATTTTASVKTPEPESEAPSRIQPPVKPLSFTNGVLKRHRHLTTATPPPVTYGECLKNHAAAIGGHAVDGCGEFMPSPTATATDPTSLKCAACGCHRNFHRRDPDDPPPQHVIEYHPHHRHHPPPPPHGGHCSPNSSSPPPISSSYYPSAPHMLLALSAGLAGHPPETHPSIAAPAAGNSSGRKRFRTKFTQDQKDRMLEFADRIGWKVQKRDDDLIASFCSEVGVERGVLKVWMHNNKNTMGKRDLSNNNNNNVVITGATEVDTTTQSHHDHDHDHDNGDVNYGQDPTHHHQFHNSNDTASTHVTTNGSSSSS